MSYFSILLSIQHSTAISNAIMTIDATLAIAYHLAYTYNPLVVMQDLLSN